MGAKSSKAKVKVEHRRRKSATISGTPMRRRPSDRLEHVKPVGDLPVTGGDQIVRRCFTSTAVFVVLTLLGKFDGSAAERWSRQVSNSEWIPLANPGTASAQLPRGNAENGLLSSSTHIPNPIQTLALPPALQQQYQNQLLQLQKTQESIQKLLLLQQQLKAQQQLLQTQTLLPGDYSSAEDEKQALPPSAVGNLQPEIASEALVPPQPPSGALPPVRPPQNFLSQRPGQAYQNQELTNLPVQGQAVLQHGGNVEDVQEIPHAYVTKQESHRPDGKRLKGQPNPGLPQSSLIGSDEEEVQLVYVPAETLAQRGQPKRIRGRKQYPVRPQHQHRENQGIDQTSLLPEQEVLTRQVLQQIQKEHEEKAQFLKEERMREFHRLNEEQKALERKTRLQQEALQREQELLRQKEAEKKRKELERLEEMARQRELDRIREAREKQRQEELERRRLSELRVKEERRREEEARQREEMQKELEQQRILEGQQENQLQATNPNIQNPQSQALIREQARRQQLSDGTRIKKIRGRQRPRINQYQEQSTYREVTTTPSPNQPPLSVYMGSSSSRLDAPVRVTDVLKILKNAKTIAVLDNVSPNSPQVFVGPSNLDPPYGYAKFDLPYLSSLDHNRVERKVDKLPFFVAPLSFNPPPGYSKIPFPAPHIGSVVINNLSETSSEPDTPTDEQNPSPTPLIEPNSYSDTDQSGSIATTASYDSSSTQNFSPESNSHKYEPTYSTPSNSKFRFRQYYDNKPSTVVGTSYYDEQSTAKSKPKHYYEQEKLTTQPPKLETTISYRQEVTYSSTPHFQDRSVSPRDPSAKEQDLAAQLALINQELVHQREPQKYNTAEHYHSQSNLGESYDVNDVRAPVGPAQYNLPAELPPISPHLPGLINSLLDKQEVNPPVASTPPPATTTTTTTTPTTTTTTRISSTTYRTRGRGRTIPTRPRTTQAPGNRTERTRRPTYNRSKSRFTTTTEDYHDSSYEPTKAKTPETTQKYNALEHRRPTSRTHKYRNRDRASSLATDQSNNVQANYENYPQSDSQSNASPDAYSSPSGSASGLYQKETPLSGTSNYPENYPTATTQTENYPPSLREIQHSTPVVSDDYSRRQNYPQNRPQEAHYQQDATYIQNDGFQQPGLEKTPVNGFNYQLANENAPDQTIPQRSKEYPHYQEDANYHLATTVDSRVTPGEENRYSPIYEVNVPQAQPDYNAGGQNSFDKIENAAIETDPNASPIFVPLQQNKQEDYELPSSEPLIEMTTTSTTTPAPVIIRQRVRARLGGRSQQDSAIQTRPRGSQDEYVRFSAVNNDSGRGAGQRHRDGSRTRTRARPQSHGSQVQTEGNEYIKIHAAQQRLAATTVPPTTTTTTTARTVEEEDVDYGFIRPPNFRPVQPVHPVDTRFQAPVTYRPALSEVRSRDMHIFSNDDTAVETGPSHTLKNRPRYQTSNRRPTTKTFTTTTTSTTTESVPVATTMPDDAAYSVRPKTRPDESRSTRVRGRVRRPGKKRITTTTESGLDANNELPLDENYPRVTPQQLPTTASGQQPLYDDNFDVPPQFVPNQNRPTQFYEENSENYPSQEFLLNFGNLPEQVPLREEYDQAQLASVPSKKYSHSSRGGSSAHSNAGDIYGAESQWSTKLSKTSFQPSFAENHVPDEAKSGRGRADGDRENEDAPEIITAGPEVSSVTMVVSSDYQKQPSDPDDTDTTMDGFGWRTNAQDHTEEMNVTTAVTNSPTTVLQAQADKETLPESRPSGSNENLREQMDDGARVTKPDSPSGRKTRRRKVRVRVRPLVNSSRPAADDFVTAESQHYNSAVNSLVQDQYKYNPIRESRFTTVRPIVTTVTASTAAAAEPTKKSFLQDFLEEMLKNDAISIPTRVTSVTTELPDGTISTPVTTPMTTLYGFSNDGEVTTLKENNAAIDTTLMPKLTEVRATTANENSSGSKDEATSPEGTISRLPQEETEAQQEAKPEDYWNKKENSQEDKSEQNDLENVEVFNQRYKLPSNYDKSGIPKKDEDSTTKLSAIGAKDKEHVMTLKRQENNEENEAHPKNHKTQWSEVKYPLTFDKPQTTSNSYSTTLIPGIVTQDKGDGNVKTLSDYVKAIFDSMKNAEGEGEVEIAKVIEAKSATDNYNLNDTATAHAAGAKESEEIDRSAGTAGSPQDISATRRAEVDENGTRTQEATTRESATAFEATTLIPDTTATTSAIPSESTLGVTEPSTTTTKTSIGEASNVFRMNSTMLGKVLRTSTTTKVSHMTEICYRGRCVMTRPKMDDEVMTR
ncbi:mucin-12 [Monomorium pharaonis]|uniref:mucin-12 n=1 Tax=Monomorium pharaonis TaxID=307658 RepID=UPI0017463A36|nr:mucin-12 [Monomorium pharaonis]